MDAGGDVSEHSSWASSTNSENVPRRNNISLTSHSMISGTVTVKKLHAAQPYNKITILFYLLSEMFTTKRSLKDLLIECIKS